jgi:hypothetical protein
MHLLLVLLLLVAGELLLLLLVVVWVAEYEVQQAAIALKGSL